MARVGRAYNEFRRATSQLSDAFNRTLQAELNEGRSAVPQTKDVLLAANTTVNEVVAGTQATIGFEPTQPATEPAATVAPSAAPAEVARNVARDGTTDTTGLNGDAGKVVEWSWDAAAQTP